MAKKVLIEYVDINSGRDQKYNITKGKTDVMEFPLIDDVNIEVSSTFASMTENIPLLGQITSLMTTLAGLGGSISEGTLNFQNLSNIQRWQKTEPIKMNLNLLFYTKKSAKEDVYDPMMNLISLTILQKDTNSSSKNPRYKTPGLNLGSLKQATKKGQEDKLGVIGNSRLIAVRIPGIIYLPLALITKAVPTISKEETDSGYPLWATLNIEISGLYPATDDLLRKEDTSFGFLGEISNKSDLVTNREARLAGGQWLDSEKDLW